MMSKFFGFSIKLSSVYDVASCGSCVRISHNQVKHLATRFSSRLSSSSQNESSSLHNRNREKVFLTSVRKMGSFKFTDYDCIGFDLDNTVLRYNVTTMAQLEYEVLAKFMVEQRAYDRKYLYKPLGDEDLNFIQKGLILDFDRGNIIKLHSDGTIGKASHGTKLLSDEEILKIYPNRRWEATDAFTKDFLETWNGPVSLKMRCLLDYFDMPASLVFARAVDAVDAVDHQKLESPKSYKVWPDVLDGLMDMFDGKNFRAGTREYFPALKKNPEKYLRKCSPQTIAWLRELKRKRVTFLITGSYADFADFTASYALGEDWKSLFDVVVCFAKKPGFFTGERPFISMCGYDEDETITGAQLARGGIYSQGNWKELKKLLSNICKNDSPKCVYVGDNLIQDIYVPAAHGDCDTVVVSEELQSEGIQAMPRHPDEKTLNSTFWGSYFCLKEAKSSGNSFWSHVIENYSKICVPSMDIISGKSIDASYDCFGKGDKKTHGFHPSKPQSL